MKFMVVGINHANLSLDERGNFYFRESDKLAFSLKLQDHSILQSLILSTCNRSEVYAIADDSFDETILKELFVGYFHQANDHIVLLSNQEALNHLLEVSCGLQSMVIGEDQILHQIKDALSWSMEQKFTGKELNYIFQNAIGFSKRMKNTYSLSEHPLSVSYIGFLSIIEKMKPTDTVMILGSGEMSQLMLKYLANYRIYLVNRTFDKVKMYLNDKVTYVPFEARYQYIHKVDVVISATSSPHLVFDSDKFTMMHPTIFLDLAMPRDIDIRFKDHPLATLIDMDDLKEISNTQLQKRQEIALKVKEECEKETKEMINQLSLMKHDNLIQKMQQNYLDISNSTYELLNNKLDLNAHEQYVLKKVLNTQFLRLMKEPIRLMKNASEADQLKYKELMENLLNLKEEE